MKKVLVTGATGFIGGQVVRELVTQGIEVIAVVREQHEVHGALPTNVATRVVYCDMEQYERLPELIEDRDIDTAYHFAWMGVSGEKTRDTACQLASLQATLTLIGALDKMQCKTFVGAGSLHEIEGHYEMQENKPVSNLSYMYKSTKLAAHWMGKALAGSKGMRFFWPIITNTYGEGETSKRLINSVIRSILHGESPALSAGEQYYDFIHISDLAHAFYLIGEKGVDGTNYTIGSNHPRPLKEYLTVVGEIANRLNCSDIPLGFGKIVSNVVYLPPEELRSNRLEEDTGFFPQVSFEEGIERTARWIAEDEAHKQGGAD